MATFTSIIEDMKHLSSFSEKTSCIFIIITYNGVYCQQKTTHLIILFVFRIVEIHINIYITSSRRGIQPQRG